MKHKLHLTRLGKSGLYCGLCQIVTIINIFGKRVIMSTFRVNQRARLKTVLVEAGIPADHRLWPLEGFEFVGNKIEVTSFGVGEWQIHFCQSHWELPGAERKVVNKYDDLSICPVIEVCSAIPGAGSFSVRARIRYDKSTDTIRLSLLTFVKIGELPENHQPVIEDVWTPEAELVLAGV